MKSETGGYMKNISLIDLKRQYASIAEEADAKILEVLHGAQYIMGENVLAFEREFAAYIGTKHAVSVSDGTNALIIALKALGIGAGDEVITTPFTFFATAESISYVGATPVFVDVEEDTFNMDPTKIEAAITEKRRPSWPFIYFRKLLRHGRNSNRRQKHDLFRHRSCGASAGGVQGEESRQSVRRQLSAFSDKEFRVPTAE